VDGLTLRNIEQRLHDRAEALVDHALRIGALKLNGRTPQIREELGLTLEEYRVSWKWFRDAVVSELMEPEDS
jgi:hypothetical protein